MGQQEARVHDVVLLLPQPVVDVGHLELDVGHSGLLGVAPAEVDLGRVEVDADDVAGQTDEGRQVERDLARTAADVEAAHAGAHAGPAQQRQRRRPHHASDDAHPLAALDAAADQVVVLVHRPSRPDSNM